VRYRLSSLLALVVCAMTPAGHDSVTAAAEWCRRATAEELAAFGLPYHPLLGRYRVPSEKTLRSVLGRLDPAELSAAGFAYLTSLLPDERASPAPRMPDGGPERERAAPTRLPPGPIRYPADAGRSRWTENACAVPGALTAAGSSCFPRSATATASLVQVVTVDGLLFPHARQVLRIQRRRRLYGAKKWSCETVYAITDLPAEQADAVEIAAWARGHWTVEVRHEALCFRTGVRDPRRLVVAAAG
jgi:hypothetical protein